VTYGGAAGFFLRVGVIAVASAATGKTKAQLATELSAMSRRVADLEAARKVEPQGHEVCRQLLDTIQDALFVVDSGERVRYMNSAAARFFRQPVDEVVGQPVGVLFPTKVAAQHLVRLRSVLKTGASYSGEVETVFPPGRMWMHVSLMPLSDDSGAVTGVCGVARDITARKQTEETLRASEGRYRALVEAVGDLVFVIDRDDLVQYINEAGARLFGSHANELIGERREEIFGGWPDWYERQGESLQGVFETGEAVYSESFARYPGGTRWQGTSLAPVRDSDSNVVAVIGIGRDLTAHKQSEDALAEANSELEARLAFIERVSSQISALNRLGQMLQGCRNEQDAYEVFGSVAEELFPGTSGCLATREETGDLLDVVAEWGDLGKFEKTFPMESCWALRLGRAYETAQGGLHAAHLNLDEDDSALCVPLTVGGRSLGLLSLASTNADDVHGEIAQQHAVSVAEEIALVLGNLRLRQRLEDQAIHDSLTQLYNRRFFEETFRREHHRAARNGESLALILMDIDRLKDYNDDHGHAAGDAVLRASTAVMTKAIRREDAACRIGGDEFVVLLPGASADEAMEKAEEIRAEVGTLTLSHGDRLLEPITLSVGVAVFPEDGLQIDDLMAAADSALHSAKETGRNRVESAG
jgi:diguanylate cyclase (GGDEF)-like protein/PAS domain S-box-containing protein